MLIQEATGSGAWIRYFSVEIDADLVGWVIYDTRSDKLSYEDRFDDGTPNWSTKKVDILAAKEYVFNKFAFNEIEKEILT